MSTVWGVGLALVARTPWPVRAEKAGAGANSCTGLARSHPTPRLRLFLFRFLILVRFLLPPRHRVTRRCPRCSVQARRSTSAEISGQTVLRPKQSACGRPAFDRRERLGQRPRPTSRLAASVSWVHASGEPGGGETLEQRGRRCAQARPSGFQPWIGPAGAGPIQESSLHQPDSSVESVHRAAVLTDKGANLRLGFGWAGRARSWSSPSGLCRTRITLHRFTHEVMS